MSLMSNIHKIASQIIPRQQIEYRKAGVRTVSSAGLVMTSFGNWISVMAHVQPGIVSSFGGKNISEKDYKDFGLDFSRRYYTIWTDGISLSTTAGQNTADQVKINGATFNIIHVADWIDFNGFRRCYVEEVLS